VEQAEQAADAPEIDAADLHQVEFTASGKSIRVGPGETVHAAAAKLGLMIPKACGMGICGTCKVMKLGGEVEMEHNGGITEDDEAEGLSCRAAACRRGMCGLSSEAFMIVPTLRVGMPPGTLRVPFQYQR
jgi:ferredoxin